ncbi:MAG: YihY/virulence factor BrkB family protein [Acidimicrobiales bacterium]
MASEGVEGRIESKSANLTRRAASTEHAVEAKAEATERVVEARAEATEHAVEAKANTALSVRPRLARAADLVRGVVRQQSAEQVSLAASGAAFWLIISAFPTAVAVVSLFGLIVPPAKVANDLGTLARAAPSSLGSLITDQLRQVAASDRQRLSVGLAISLVTAAWSASAGVYNLDRAVRYSFGLPRSRYLRARARALSGAAALVVVLGALALSASVVGARAPAGVVAGAGIPVAFVAFTAGTTTMYRLAVGSVVPIRRLLPGAVAAAVAAVTALTAFAIYLAVSTRFTALYGAFAGLVIGMVGMYLAVYAVLLGAVLDARLDKLP